VEQRPLLAGIAGPPHSGPVEPPAAGVPALATRPPVLTTLPPAPGTPAPFVPTPPAAVMPPKLPTMPLAPTVAVAPDVPFGPSLPLRAPSAPTTQATAKAAAHKTENKPRTMRFPEARGKNPSQVLVWGNTARAFWRIASVAGSRCNATDT
jgi:hypothetical protein